MPIIFDGTTHIGMKRKTNQDSIFMSKELNFFLVADGMGGHNGGDIASSIAAKAVPEYLEKHRERLEDPALVIEAFQYANSMIFQQAVENPQLEGMGTTIVSLSFVKSDLFIGNVGDSRAYLVSKGNLYQLTKDHSLVQEKLNLGIYSREEASKDRMKNVLVRTIGFEEEVDVDVFSYKVSRNDLLLICSDGLYGKVSDRDLHHIINQYIPDPSQATQESVHQLVHELVDQANKNGGQDNISVIVVIAQ